MLLFILTFKKDLTMRVSTKRGMKILFNRKKALMIRAIKRYTETKEYKYISMVAQAIHLHDPIYIRSMCNTGGKWVVSIDESLR